MNWTSSFAWRNWPFLAAPPGRAPPPPPPGGGVPRARENRGGWGVGGGGGADTGDVRRGVEAGLPDIDHRGERALARRAAGTVGNGEKPRLELRELTPGGAQFLRALGGLGREGLEAESARVLLLAFHVPAR